ncbi:aspartate/glutamate racemase family protein [Frigidibacter sp.]|uniref:aspartate/glutamate racemase family protein n=1 Tax=Frigidibacter sp. TaxID=2586418 RepID=UPI00273539E8|nr:aspartate/glutamate racemase family protein [Frigidibacter sp.]MDP3339213.1 aspartate/glutamate racemase family protein [Frigidibacter sp.]
MTLAPAHTVVPLTSAEAPLWRLLVVNPNSNPAVNFLLRAVADRVLPAGAVAQIVSSAQSPLSIETPAHRARAEPLAVGLLAAHPGFDAYVMACFDDIALSEGRRLLPAPVIGAVEAAVAMARLRADRFAVVTTVETAIPGIRRVLDGLGAGPQCAVHAAGIGVATAANGSRAADLRLDAAIAHARDRGGAGAIILGSAGLAGRAAELEARHGLPVIDAMEAAIRLAYATVRTRQEGPAPQSADI